VINDVLKEGGDLPITVQPFEDSYMVLLGTRRAFIVTPGDVDPLRHDTPQETAMMAADRLRQAVTETAEGRNLSLMLQAAGYSALATLIFLALARLIFFLRSRILQVLPGLLLKKNRSLKVGQTPIVEVLHLYPVLSRIGQVLRWGLLLLLGYEWLSFVLSRFPYTRPWGERLNSYFLDVASYLLDAVIGSVPGLGVAIAIYLIARAVSGFTQRLLRRSAASGNVMGWLNHETLPTTSRLSAMAIWLFALAMAYPYLPGAGTDAFKGLSVLLGLMVSLGASSVVGQAASGLILTYTRTLRPGEYVRIGEHEGTVTEMGMFTTRIRTGLGEVLSIPNSMITGSVTKNYSRVAEGGGYVVDTTLTIGYDTPWRQVEGMLVEAARRTEGIISQPAPQVFQTALTDFYPQYRLVAQAIPSQPRPRAELLSTLHANIQDVFSEYGVQIMSPHYVNDPARAKLVDRADWFQPPAVQP
jgi:small-conductance mechanosensitive channel